MKHILEDTDITLTNIHDTIRLSSPPWLLKQPVIILDLNKLPKNKTHPLTYQEKLNSTREISQSLTHFHGWLQKQQWNWMWSSSPQENLVKMPPPKASIFSIKICAINLALKLVSTRKSPLFIQTPFQFYNLLKIQNLIIHSLSSF